MKDSLHGFHGDIQNECRCIKEDDCINGWFGISVECEGCPLFRYNWVLSPPSLMDTFIIRLSPGEMSNQATGLDIQAVSKALTVTPAFPWFVKHVWVTASASSESACGGEGGGGASRQHPSRPLPSRCSCPVQSIDAPEPAVLLGL